MPSSHTHPVPLPRQFPASVMTDFGTSITTLTPPVLFGNKNEGCTIAEGLWGTKILPSVNFYFYNFFLCFFFWSWWKDSDGQKKWIPPFFWEGKKTLSRHRDRSYHRLIVLRGGKNRKRNLWFSTWSQHSHEKMINGSTRSLRHQNNYSRMQIFREKKGAGRTRSFKQPTCRTITDTWR